AALVRRLGAVHDGVAQHVLERRHHALEHLTIEIAGRGKQVELEVTGAGDLDRQVLERMVPPFEHMLRNAVVHGAEAPDERRRAGKPATATVTIALQREGSEMVIALADDGAGMDVDAILASARKRGLIDADVSLSDADALELILEPGFSTASELTQAAGRGVGMDVVANEVKQLGGRLELDSVPGKGARITVRLPLTLAISQALLVRTAEELYAIPMPTVEGIVRLPKTELLAYLEADDPGFEYGGQRYRFEHLGVMLGGRPANLAEGGASVPVVLVRAGEHSAALITDEIVGSREVVVKNVGPQIASIRGVAGATILGDGSIVVILDVHSLVRAGLRHADAPPADEPRVDERPLILVVDDSITVRRVTERLLERNDMRVVTARDGVDAVAILQDLDPHLILLDIEMPRMDGYEVASHVRNSERTRDVPIVMVTSRVGDKHRARAFELGVNDYLGKPYQESQLLGAIRPLLESYTPERRSLA
ncbi:MAG: response regulator, partial [Pseudomonadota bacterium]